MTRVAFPRMVRDYLTGMAPHTGVVWQRDGKPGIVIKLPVSIEFSKMSVVIGSIQKVSPSTFHVTLHLQGKGHRPTSIRCLIHPDALPDRQVFDALLSAKKIEVYAVTPDRAYLGTQVLPWPPKKRRLLAELAGHLLVQQPPVVQSLREPPPAPDKKELSLTPLHATYRQTLQKLHHAEDVAMQHTGQQDVTAQLTLSNLVKSIHVFEEHILAHAHLITLASEQAQRLTEHRAASVVYFPNHPLWIECHHPVPGYWRNGFGILGARATYEHRPLAVRAEGKAYYRVFERQSRWRLEFVDQQGTLFLRLLTSLHFANGTLWGMDPSHICPIHACETSDDTPSARSASPAWCATCLREADFWRARCNTLLAIALKQPLEWISRPPVAPQPALRQHPGRAFSTSPAPEQTKGMERQRVPLPPPAPPRTTSPGPAVPLSLPTSPLPPVRKPVIVTHALLIDRYKQAQSNTQKQEALEQAHKFLWMHSAWFMTEALRQGVSAEEPLRLPTDHVYIELEQPRQLHGLEFAACSFQRLSGNKQTFQRWQYTIIDTAGSVRWGIYYEVNPAGQPDNWMFPKEYACPDQQCQVEDTPDGRVFHLCELCQRRVTHYTSWLTIALRMIAGDFQEQVEMREPEEVLETSTQTIQDAVTGQVRKKPVLYRFKVIRYHDACVHRSGTPQTKRGSWMTGRPLAESEFDVNPAAILYVQIQPRDHDRTYHHDRYTYMKGKTQHIDPHPRLQPMTMATFRQLPSRQSITKVYASNFVESA